MASGKDLEARAAVFERLKAARAKAFGPDSPVHPPAEVVQELHAATAAVSELSAESASPEEVAEGVRLLSLPVEEPSAEELEVIRAEVFAEDVAGGQPDEPVSTVIDVRRAELAAEQSPAVIEPKRRGRKTATVAELEEARAATVRAVEELEKERAARAAEQKVALESIAEAQALVDDLAAQEEAYVPTVIESLLAVMEEVESIGKGMRNEEGDGGRGFLFRGVDQVINAVGPLFRKHGVLGPVPMLERAGYRDVRISAASSQISQEVTVDVRYRFFGRSGDFIDAIVPGESVDPSDKGAAKAMSVAYRIALLQTLCIPTGTPDPDATSPQRHSVPARGAQEPAKPSGQAVAGEENQAADGRQAAAGEEAQAAAVIPAETDIEKRQVALAKEIIKIGAESLLVMDRNDIVRDFGEWTKGDAKHPGEAAEPELVAYRDELLRRIAEAQELAEIEKLNKEARTLEARKAEEAAALDRAQAKNAKLQGA